MRLSTLAVLALSALPFQTGCDFEGLDTGSRHYHEDFHYTYDVKPGARLSVSNFNGEIEILGWERSSVQITGTKYAESEALLKDLQIEVRAEDNSVAIRSVHPPGASWHMGARYFLRVPREINLDDIASSNAPIRVEDIQGNARLETSNGGVRLRNVNGRFEVTTSNGAVEGGELEGEMRISTSNGAIRLDQVRGAVMATTSNGVIRAELVKAQPGQRLQFETSNGRIELICDALEDNGLDASTSNASIVLRLPASVKAAVHAATSDATITSEFEVAPKGPASKTELDGQINGGGSPIRLSTSHGEIRIEKL